MNLTYEGDRIDIAGQVLRRGESIEVSDEDGAALIANKFPFVVEDVRPQAEKEE